MSGGFTGADWPAQTIRPSPSRDHTWISMRATPSAIAAPGSAKPSQLRQPTGWPRSVGRSRPVR
jgi:hypothetical protein